ncbi:hypothetical protein M405DRAFT_829852 [Rhizopogon salebrosus TDB-379]|nr:hypothetical protein M405DRAFT_829852 [Rhizopogon salebrosus TDB-379]
MAVSSTNTPVSLQISDISIDFSRSYKIVESAELRLSGIQRLIARSRSQVGNSRNFQETFVPPLTLSPEDSFSLRLSYRKRFSKNKIEDVVFDTGHLFNTCSGVHERHDYHTFRGKIAIVVKLVGNTGAEQQGQQSSNPRKESLDLDPTTDDIFRICPRFRILVIGKTGVGKSSLINQAFGVKRPPASDSMSGEAIIDTEFTWEQNGRFVLHDSKGFEPGEEDSVNIVKDFIERRGEKEALGERLHAVWLCFEIPRTGGRLLETGTQDFLKLKRDGALGNIPVVVVLTKYDKFIDHVDRMFDDSALEGLSDDVVKELVTQKADAEFRKICALPLEKFAGEDIPCATVSAKVTHKEMIASLIQITEDRVCQHVASEASMMISIAQRVDPKLKIKTSIEVGKRRYWKALASTAAFRGNTVGACLQVLHIDIVRVWNFSDPHDYLDSKEFKNLMVNLVDKVDVGSIANLNRNMMVGLSTVAAIAGIVSALSGPAAPIVVPIAASVVLAKWVHDVYQLSRVVLQHFVAYIIDLTLVLQTLYLVCDSQELSRRSIKLAVGSYLWSTMSARMHARIKRYDGHLQLPLSESADQDTLDMIVKLMDECSIDASEISELRAKIPAVGSVPDEQW